MKVLVGDCRLVMPTLDECSVDAVVTDPPYELGFMGKRWDKTGVAVDVEMWRAVMRLMKPGAHMLAFGGTRTYHRMACAIEDAGFEIRDCLVWLYGSGFPKSLNLGDGLGTALKPAHEPIVLARKPLDGTVAANLTQHGTGVLNVDGCRVATDWNEPDRPESWKRSGHTAQPDADKIAAPPGEGIECHPGGRWPPNVLLDEGAAELLDEAAGERSSGLMAAGTVRATTTGYSGHMPHATAHATIGDSGGASRFFPRFFYVAKASTTEREAGLGGLAPRQRDETRDQDAPGANNPRNRGGRGRANHHPTVKPLELMRWLVRLVTPPGGVVLDPFCGSGTTGMACRVEGFRFIGIEMDPEHAANARRRIAACRLGCGEPLGSPRRVCDERQAELFAEARS